jgi:hypothetical protein
VGSTVAEGDAFLLTGAALTVALALGDEVGDPDEGVLLAPRLATKNVDRVAL